MRTLRLSEHYRVEFICTKTSDGWGGIVGRGCMLRMQVRFLGHNCTSSLRGLDLPQRARAQGHAQKTYWAVDCYNYLLQFNKPNLVFKERT